MSGEMGRGWPPNRVLLGPASRASCLVLVAVGVSLLPWATHHLGAQESARDYQVVRNGPEGLWTRSDGWLIEEVSRLGSIEGDGAEAFGGGQLSVRRRSDGSVFVLDHQAKEIKVFDRTGRFLRTIGSPGQGPGEFGAPMGMLIDSEGQLWVPEAFSGRYTIFSAEGDFVRTMPRPLRTYNRLRPLPFLTAETFVDHSGNGPGAAFFLMDTAGQVRESYPPLEYPPLPPELGGPLLGPPDGPVRQAVRRLMSRLLWTIAPDGTLWFGYSDALRLVQRTLAGDTLRIIETGHRQVGFSGTERDLAGRAERELGVRDVFVPQVMAGLHVLSDGHVLVQIMGDMGEGGREYDVFDPEGRFLGTIEAPFTMPTRTAPDFTGDTIVVVDTDEWDVPYVVTAVIRR